MLDIALIATLATAAVGVLSSILATFFTKYFSDLTRKDKIKVGQTEIVLTNNTDETLREIYKKVLELQEHPRVFLSYASADRDFARRLNQDLRAQGIDTWTAEEQIRVGDSLAEKIEDGISTSQWVIFVVSGNSLKSRFITRELDLALQNEKLRKRPLVLPVAYQGDELPPQLEDRMFADFRHDYESGLKALLVRLKPASTFVTS